MIQILRNRVPLVTVPLLNLLCLKDVPIRNNCSLVFDTLLFPVVVVFVVVVVVVVVVVLFFF